MRVVTVLPLFVWCQAPEFGEDLMKDQGGVMLEVEEGPGFREEEGEEDGSEAEGSWTDEDEEEARLQAGRGVELDARQRGAAPVVPPAPAPSEKGKAPAGKGKAPERKVSRAEAIIENEGTILGAHEAAACVRICSRTGIRMSPTSPRSKKMTMRMTMRRRASARCSGIHTYHSYVHMHTLKINRPQGTSVYISGLLCDSTPA
jgi:hypothetical protein